MFLKLPPTVQRLIEYYCNFKIWIFASIILNTVIIHFINKYLKKQGPERIKINLCSFKALYKDYIILFILAFIFIAWKTVHLGRESFDIMESANIFFVFGYGSKDLLPFSYMLEYVHQPLYSLILKIIANIFKNNIFTLRIISLFFALFTSLFLFRFSYEVFKNRFISYAAFLFINVHILPSFYSRRIEPYTMFCFLTLLSYYYFWRAFINRKEGIWKYCLVSIICFFTHYIALVVIFSQILTIFLIKSYKDNTKFYFSTLLLFLKSLFILGYVIILWFPAIYLSILNNSVIFSDAWSNNFYLNPEKITFILNNILRVILGFPSVSITYVFLPLLMYVIFKLKKEKPFFYFLVIGILCSSLFYESVLVLYGFKCTGKLYFNVRHFIWLVPFVTLLYAFALSILFKTKIRIYARILGCAFFLLIFSWNFIETNKLIFGYTMPSYKEALRYIKKEYKKGDFIGWPVFWIPPIQYNSSEFSYPQTVGFGQITPLDLLEKKYLYKRFWLIVPWEDYFGVPHLNNEFINSYINFFKKNLSLDSSWSSNKIDVYLFNNEDK